MEHLPILFLATLIAAIGASAPPGLLNVNAAKIAVDKGKRAGLSFSLGIALTVAFQVYLAVRIGKFLNRNPEVVEWLMKAAVLLFAVLTVFFFVKGYKKSRKAIPLDQNKKRNSFLGGFFLAWLNFLQIPFYSWLNTFFYNQHIMMFDVSDEIVFILSAAFGTFLVMYLYVFYFNKLETKTNWFSKNSNYVLSGLMLVLLFITTIRIFYH
ncbi:LysE family transporter [Croceivirga thetidis]|uniref:LysE family transporter n=1 Tax=Croceivirga thetidis TaxID=2721623 RepID=A0ABX1GRB7_9FLAO|nr:LysE family transporter [Croceivirga thetidis]NKI31600.1 LysE family transporter [Croceivirga thetidis]